MCNAFQINGVFCENIGEFRAAIGDDAFQYVIKTNYAAPPTDSECLCRVDYDRMREIYQEIEAPNWHTISFVGGAKLGGGE